MSIEPEARLVTMRLAAEALQEHLSSLLQHAQELPEDLVRHYTDRYRFVGELVDAADPDDIFAQDRFRRAFLAELAALPPA